MVHRNTTGSLNIVAPSPTLSISGFSTDLSLPRGVRDILPERTARRNALIGKVLSVFESYEYSEVTTPFLEYLDVITQGAGKDLKKRIVKFTDRATGRSLSLRTDFTPQISRVVETNHRLK